MSGQQHQATFHIPIVIPAELAELTTDMKTLMDDLRLQIEFYKTHSEQKIFSEKQAAEFFGISTKSIREERNAGKIDYTPVKGQFFYTRQNLEDYIAEQQTRAKKGRK